MSDTTNSGEQSPKAEPADAAPRLVTDNSGLRAENIGKRYRSRPVLRDVNLSLQRGEAVGLLGPNGAGKTTCFYLITGLIAPDYGTIFLDGQDITELPMYRRSRLGIGYLPQEASIFRGLSVENNIRAVLEIVEPVHERREAILDDLLAEAGSENAASIAPLFSTDHAGRAAGSGYSLPAMPVTGTFLPRPASASAVTIARANPHQVVAPAADRW